MYLTVLASYVELREGVFDVLVGINLLREGLDLPEVSLVAILDADRPGFLRSVRSLVQTAGRAARNVDGEVILYGDDVTEAMERGYEVKHSADVIFNYNITPTTTLHLLLLKRQFRNLLLSRRPSAYKAEEIGAATCRY